jgi:hypothetical protein
LEEAKVVDDEGVLEDKLSTAVDAKAVEVEVVGVVDVGASLPVPLPLGCHAVELEEIGKGGSSLRTLEVTVSAVEVGAVADAIVVEF